MKQTLADTELTGPVKQMKYATTDPDGKYYGYELSFFDEKGLLLKWEDYTAGHQLDKTLLYTFDDKGNLVEKTLTSATKGPIYKNSYFENGELKDCTEYYGEDTLYTLYDESGNVLQQMENNDPTPVEEDPYNEQWETNTHTDTDGCRIEISRYYSFGALQEITRSRYNHREQLLEEYKFRDTAGLDDNNPTETTICQYNEQGHLITKISDRTTTTDTVERTVYRYEFTYDLYHNWIEKVEIMNNKVTGYQDKVRFIRRREILYAP
ncbi:hypothetical protein [Chitinophaga sp.]|uniref:hypothetical protein n=1 Tax=Chitinophaga sp. TaxID=1869181 RepID=UPI002BF5C95D|nr:hypothetical protein [Chitinophaga sp.]HWV69232.1 hypothetical protein [Chitinophaga sp.]